MDKIETSLSKTIPNVSTSVPTHIKSEIGEIMNSCRVCMIQSFDIMQRLFEAGPENIIDKIVFCTGIKFAEVDGFPNHICKKCLDNLSVAHQFKTLCLHSDEMCQKLLKSRVKTEDLELDDDRFTDVNFYDDKFDVKDEILTVLKQNNVKIKRSRLKKKPEKDKLDIKPLAKTRKKPADCKTIVTQDKLHCETCNITFTSSDEHHKHKKVIHNDKSWICEICGKVFIHRGSHYMHVRSHLPPKYGCEQCDYKTWHKYDLVKHIRIHGDIRLYQCEYCTAAFHTSSNLTGHIKRFHQGIKRFQCHMCERSFYDRTKLNRHVDSHNDIKRYECEVCHTCFSRRCYWKKHLHRQHGVVIPAQRPGRQKTNMQIREISSTDNTVLVKSVGVV